MSVTYILNIPVKIRDLKENGFEVINNGESYYQFIITDKDSDSSVGVLSLRSDKEDSTDDDLEITKLEGRFSHGGGVCMLKICDKLDRKFVTDEDIDELLMMANMEGEENKEDVILTNEMFDYRTNNFREYFTEKEEKVTNS